jgi:hypothetical protein
MVSTPRAGRDSRKAPEEILKDLAQVLAGDQAVYFRLGPEGAVMSVKAPDSFAYGDAVDVRWREMTPEERALAILAWIRKAAKYCRKPRVRWGAGSPLPA